MRFYGGIKEPYLSVFFGLWFLVYRGVIGQLEARYGFSQKIQKDTNLGIWFGGLPLEEYLFIILVTFEVSTLTLVLKHKMKNLVVTEDKK